MIDMSQKPSSRRSGAWIYFAAGGIALSIFAMVLVVGAVAAGTPRQPDETAAAHLFQLAMVAQIPLSILVIATADWSRRRRVFELLLVQVGSALAALGALAWSGY